MTPEQIQAQINTATLDLAQAKSDLQAAQAALSTAQANVTRAQAAVDAQQAKLEGLNKDLAAAQAALAAQGTWTLTAEGSAFRVTFGGLPQADHYRLIMIDKNNVVVSGGGVWLSSPTYFDKGLRVGDKVRYRAQAEDGANKVVAAITSPTLTAAAQTPAPTPPPQPTPTPTPTPPPATKNKLVWELRSEGSRFCWADQLTQADIDAINASPVDGISLMVPGFSLEACQTGFRFNEAQFRAALDKIKGKIKKRVRILIRTTFPSDPLENLAAWDTLTAEHAKAARILSEYGIDGFDHDQEPYQTSSGGALVASNPEVLALSKKYGVAINQGSWGWNYWDFSWVFLFREAKYQATLEAWGERYAKTLAAAYPGIGYDFYTAISNSDGAAPNWVNAEQAGNGFKAVGYVWRGINRAVSAGAKLVPGDLNEDFEMNEADWGTGIFQKSVDYRRLQTPLKSGIPGWETQQAFGHMRRRGSAQTSSTADVLKNLKALWPSLYAPAGGYARVGFYFETGEPLTPEIYEGIRQAKAVL